MNTFRQIETPGRDFSSLVAAYERKGWTIVARGVSSVDLVRNGETRTLIKRLGE